MLAVYIQVKSSIEKPDNSHLAKLLSKIGKSPQIFMEEMTDPLAFDIAKRVILDGDQKEMALIMSTFTRFMIPFEKQAWSLAGDFSLRHFIKENRGSASAIFIKNQMTYEVSNGPMITDLWELSLFASLEELGAPKMCVFFDEFPRFCRKVFNFFHSVICSLHFTE